MPQVSSSAIARVRYDNQRRELTLVFRSGRVYVYADVPEETYAALLAADSKGAFFNAAIRDIFPTRRQR
ncbi:KTSC domain-containing protein [Rhodoplanes serenus]|uniref:KTSC domain-containing protein n=1 Tax=Rhodoplanes serenus TaxID=200615 RepID=A0A9X4XPW5_9BRAD|nr:KTSC domain-containing protein [Rhodoplanes serenus]MTW17474.1 KTSC domain-containing protein [Rhodoplanes serenus]